MWNFLFGPPDYGCLGVKNHYFLSNFLKASNRFQYNSKKWEEFMTASPSEVVRYLVSKKWLRNANAKEVIRDAAKVTDIKEWLKKYNLKQTGKREDLVERLLTSGIDIEKDFSYITKDYYIVTEEGAKIANDYIQDYEERGKVLLEKLNNYIKTEQLKEAIDNAIEYDKSRYFKDGWIKDWYLHESYDRNRHITLMRIMLKAYPPELDYIDKETFKNTRIEAVRSYLLGNSRPKEIEEFYKEKYGKSLWEIVNIIQQYAHDTYNMKTRDKYSE